MIAGGNASADFAETFAANLDNVRANMEAMGKSELRVDANANGISFWAEVRRFTGSVLRKIVFPLPFASGGFPDTGSMFIAGEAGPELVGSFGSHNNSVINEAQLVQAFRQASSEQVALLQQQNSLLAALLDKELTFKPSSAAGKAFSQSIGMYNRAMGV